MLFLERLLTSANTLLLIAIGVACLFYFLRKKCRSKSEALERELKTSKSYMENIVTSMTDALFVITPKATIETVNAAGATLLGYTEDELIGKPFRLICEEIEEDVFNAQTLPSVKGKLQVIYDRDPEDFWSLLHNAHLGALIVGVEDKIVMANEEVESIFGYEKGKLIGKPVHELFSTRLRETHMQDHENSVVNSSSQIMDEDRIVTAKCKDGSTLELEIGIVPLNVDGQSHVLNIIHDPSDKEKWEFTKFTRFGKLFSEEAFSDVDRTLISKNKIRIPVLMSGSVLRDNSAAIHGAVLVAKDITIRNLAQEALLKSEEKSRLLLNSSGEAIYGCDLEGNCTFCNPACLHLLAYKSEDQVLGRNMRELLHRGRACEKRERPSGSPPSPSKGTHIDSEWLQRSDGTSFAAEHWSYPIISDDETVGSVSRFIDITDRKTALEARIAGKKRAHAIADSVPVLISYVDTNHCFRFNNKTYEQWFGVEREKLDGMHLRDAVGDAIYESILPRIEAALTGVEQTFEDTMVHKTLGKRFVQVRYVPEIGDDGEVFGFFSAITDLTDRRKAEEEKAQLESQLRRSQRLKTIGTLAGGIAHDFNNILTPILGYTDLALINLPPSDPLREDLQRILEGTLRAKDLVEQILLFSKEIDKERKPLHLNFIVSEALKLLRPSIPSTIRIEKRIDPLCSEILADATQMHQLVVNLCTNAWQAMENRGGTLTIEIANAVIDRATARKHPHLKENDYIRLTITDTGTGIAEEHLKRIFEPFFTTKLTDNKGTGLGLQIVNSIVNAHGGNILVDTAPGKGTSFHIYLPAIQSSVTIQAPPEQTIQGGEETILIVDDEESISTLLKRMLEQFGYVTEAFNATLEALDAFAINPSKYDLVITDLTMPHLTGLDFAKKIQDIRPDTPVIMTTGFSNKLADVRLEDYNIKYVLEKPVAMRDLALAVRNVLETKTA